MLRQGQIHDAPVLRETEGDCLPEVDLSDLDDPGSQVVRQWIDNDLGHRDKCRVRWIRLDVEAACTKRSGEFRCPLRHGFKVQAHWHAKDVATTNGERLNPFDRGDPTVTSDDRA